MALWFAALLGLLQGLTEFLPISSTAHLRIAPALLGQTDPGAAFTAVVQLGTLVAVLAYFARDLFVDLPRSLIRDRGGPGGRLVVQLVIGTVPIVIAGVFFRGFIVGDARSLYVVASALVGVGVVMWLVDRRARVGSDGKTIAQLGLGDAALVGLAQAMALVPGVSRSGATICMAIALGMARSEAARFSFLLSIPAIAGAGVFEAGAAIEHLGADAAAPILVATVIAAISGYASIAWLLRYLGTRRLTPFAIYRIVLGAVLLGLVASGTLSP